MTTTDLSSAQKAALLDLCLLAMYADGHLAGAEDARIHRLLERMGYTSEFDRNREYDASVSRISRVSQTPEATLAHAATLAQSFPLYDHRRLVQATLDDLATSDTRVSLQESSLLPGIHDAFGN